MINAGNFIRENRKKKNFTLENLAEKVGVTANYISQLERNLKKAPSDDILFNISKALDIDEEIIFSLYNKVARSVTENVAPDPQLQKLMNQIANLDEEHKKEILSKFDYWYNKIQKD